MPDLPCRVKRLGGSDTSTKSNGSARRFAITTGKYYVEAAPEITDLEYDRLLDRLKELEAATSGTGHARQPHAAGRRPPVDGLEQVVHRVPMLSIDNTYSLEELRAVRRANRQAAPDEPIEWVVELKIDGVAVSLIYENGLLGPRGNPRQRPDGRRHHPQRPHGRRRPLRLEGDDVPAVLEVRGEIYMTNSDLVRLNEAADRQRGAAVRQHAQRDGRQHPAARLRALRRATAADLLSRRGRSEGLRATNHMEFLDELPATACRRRPGCSVSSLRRRGGPLPDARSSGCTNSISKSTAWC